MMQMVVLLLPSLTSASECNCLEETQALRSTLDAKYAQKFEQMEFRYEKLEEHFAQMEVRYGKLEEKFEAFKKKKRTRRRNQQVASSPMIARSASAGSLMIFSICKFCK